MRDDYEELETITPDPILDEVNRSIRQLRADLQRTIRRYARNENKNYYYTLQLFSVLFSL